MFFEARHHYGKVLWRLKLASLTLPLFFLFFSILFFGCPANGMSQGLVTEGVLDLRGWDFKKQGVVHLDGQWEFFWNQWLDPENEPIQPMPSPKVGYIKVPVSWNGHIVNGVPIGGEGYATYRITLKLPKNMGPCSLYIPEAGTAYCLYIDGTKYKTVGKPGKKLENTTPKVESTIVIFSPKQPETQIIVLVSNYHHRYGGLWESIRFGPSESIQAARLNKVSLDYFLFGAILIMGMYHFGLYFIRKKELPAIFFALFCLLTALRISVTGDRMIYAILPSLSMSIVYKLEYLTFYLGFGTIFIYLYTLYPREFNKFIFNVCLSLIGCFSLVVILFPLSVFTWTLFLFQMISFVFLLYLCFVVFLALKKKRMGVVAFLIGFLCLLATVINDLLHAMLIINTLYLFHLGMFIFILFQSYILFHRFSLAFQIIEEQKIGLHQKNIALDVELEKRREAEKAVRTNEKKYRQLTELLPGAVFEADKEGKILFSNKAAKISFGWGISSEFETYYLTDGISSSARPYFLTFFKKALDSSLTIEFETTGKNENNEAFPAIVFLTRITDEFEITCGVRGVAIDLSQQKALEKRVRHGEKMEALGTMAGGIAHDFNNILSIIIGHTELAMLKISNNPGLTELMDVILKASFRAADLVKAVLRYSRKDKIEKQLICIKEILQSATKMLRATIPSKITIKEDYGVDILTVHADPNQIHQIILNLAKNAVDAMMPKGGNLVISVKNIDNRSFSDKYPKELGGKKYVKITFFDTGTGIESPLLNKIFDPFFTTKEPGKGTGMGLSVVQGIVQQNKGAFTVESQPGYGTSFSIYLPSVKGEAAIKSDAPPAELRNGTEHILFIDDEKDIISLNKKLLTRMGYTVTIFDSSTRALEFFNTHFHEVDLVITDQDMPEMTGAELIHEIRKIKPDLPIIMCTGFSEHDEKEAFKIGVNHLLIKPVTRHQISKAVSNVLHHENMAG